jgi:hypothetical protein
VTTLLKVILAVVGAWLGLAAPSTSADAVPISFVQTYGYDSHAQPMQLTYTTTERGPPVQHHLETTFDADGQQSFDALACSNVPTTSATYDYDDLASGRAAEQVGGTEQECVVVQGSVVAANGVARLADSGVVNPSTIRFSQNSISGTFRGGGGVKDLAAGLRNGTVNPSDIPAIRLVERDGNYFTLDNRRLAAFQEAGVDIPYRMATPSEIASQGWKFTTTNDGTSILIRGGG